MNPEQTSQGNGPEMMSQESPIQSAVSVPAPEGKKRSIKKIVGIIFLVVLLVIIGYAITLSILNFRIQQRLKPYLTQAAYSGTLHLTKTYTDERVGFQVTYPQEFEVKVSGGSGSDGDRVAPYTVRFMLPLELRRADQGETPRAIIVYVGQTVFDEFTIAAQFQQQHTPPTSFLYPLISPIPFATSNQNVNDMSTYVAVTSSPLRDKAYEFVSNGTLFKFTMPGYLAEDGKDIKEYTLLDAVVASFRPK